MKKIYELKDITYSTFFYKDLILVGNNQKDYLFFSEINYELINKLNIGNIFPINVVNDQIYLYNHDLYIYDEKQNNFVLHRRSQDGGNVILYNDFFVEKKYDQKSKEVEVTFYKKYGNQLWNKVFINRSSLLNVGEHLYITDSSLKYIDFIDDLTGEVLNTLHFENPPISRFIYSYNDTLIVSLEIKPLEEYRLLGLDARTGEEKWRIEDARYLYVQDLEKGYLYGIGGNLFQVIDVQNGKILFYERLTSEVEKYKVFPDRKGCLSPNGLYFYSNYPDCKFGLINLQTHKIEFVVDLNLSEGVKIKNMSYHNGRLYISDTNKTLHIFAEE